MPDADLSHIPESGPWEGPPACIITTSEHFDVDGKRMVLVRSRHSDGFVCLRFLDAEDLQPDQGSGGGIEPGKSVWHSGDSGHET